jgi:hypothetical protein
MKTSQEEPSFIQELPEVVIKKPEIVVPVETSVNDVLKRAPQKDDENSNFEHQEQIELMLNSKRSVSNAMLHQRLYSGESRRPTSSMAGERSCQSDSTKSKRY